MSTTTDGPSLAETYRALTETTTDTTVTTGRHPCGTRRRIGAEYEWSKLRRSGELHRRIAQAINCGELGFAMDHPTFDVRSPRGSVRRENIARALLNGIRGGQVNGYAAQGFPQAAGGVDVSAALMSVRPGIRKIKKMIKSVPIPAGSINFAIDLPKSGYFETPVIRLEGLGATSGFQVIQTATPQAITMNDLRTLVQRVRLELSSTVVPKSLSGIACDIIDNLDTAVVSANANTVPTSGALTGGASTTVYGNFVLELSPRFTISDQNLYGIPYLGALATVPQLIMDFAPLLGPAAQSPMTAAAAGPTANLANIQCKVDGWRIDLPAPVAPSQYTDANGNTVQVPGEGLWAESSYLLTTKLQKSLTSVGPGQQVPFDIPIGPMYARILILAFVDGILDTESGTAPQSMLDHCELSVQQATIIESRYPWQYDSDYRKSYYKTRPKGVYVHSGIDQSGTDEDLWVTQDLGNFQITPFATANADGNAQSRFDLYTQALQPITKPGMYA